MPYGFYNEHVKEIARNAGYEAIFTVYGQPITYTSPLDSLGRYAIEASKPKVFADAVKMIGTSTGGAAAVAEVGDHESGDSTGGRRNRSNRAATDQGQSQRDGSDGSGQYAIAR